MSDSSEMPWSNDPNAPQIPPWLHLAEKESFAGYLIGAISYGIVVALFFRCMGVLLSPENPIKKGVKLALVLHTVLLFSFLTIPVGIQLNVASTVYVDDREFPGDDGYPPGPFGCLFFLNLEATTVVFSLMFPLNQWLADGLLLHRCYVIYSMNHWVMAFPYLVYLASVAMGSAYIYHESGPGDDRSALINFATSYYSICLSLNVLLTLMIVARLVVHIKNVRKATGASSGPGELHTAAATVATMLIESYALYALALLAYIVPWAIQSWDLYLFNGAIGVTQVIAPFLIILRVAKRRALTSGSITGFSESIRFNSQGTTDDDASLHGGDHANAVKVNDVVPGEPGARDENTIEEVLS